MWDMYMGLPTSIHIPQMLGLPEAILQLAMENDDYFCLHIFLGWVPISHLKFHTHISAARRRSLCSDMDVVDALIWVPAIAATAAAIAIQPTKSKALSKTLVAPSRQVINQSFTHINHLYWTVSGIDEWLLICIHDCLFTVFVVNQ